LLKATWANQLKFPRSDDQSICFTELLLMLLLPPVAGTAAIDTETGRPLTRADHLLRRRPATWKLHWENDKQNGPRREWTIQPFLPCLPRSMQLINNPSYGFLFRHAALRHVSNAIG